MAYTGSIYVMCALCSLRFHRNECRYNWKGQIVCNDCWEPRHPQDYVRPVPDHQRALDARPEGTDKFLDYGDNTADEL
jgi:hypothetical protein